MSADIDLKQSTESPKIYASAFIRELQEHIKKYGDLPMYVDRDGWMLPLVPNEIEFQKKEYSDIDREMLPDRFTI